MYRFGKELSSHRGDNFVVVSIRDTFKAIYHKLKTQLEESKLEISIVAKI